MTRSISFRSGSLRLPCCWWLSSGIRARERRLLTTSFRSFYLRLRRSSFRTCDGWLLASSFGAFCLRLWRLRSGAWSHLPRRFIAAVALTGRRLWSSSGLFAFARDLAAPAVCVYARIVGIDIAADNLIVALFGARRRRGGRRQSSLDALISGAALAADLTEVDVAMDRVVAVEVAVVDRAPHYIAIEIDIAIPGVHVNIGAMDVRTRASHPDGATVPAVVIDVVVTPIAVVIQPRADEEADAEENRCSDVRPGCAPEHERRIIGRHVNVSRARRVDIKEASVIDDLLLCRCDQIAGGAGETAQSLNRGHHVSGLHSIGLAERCGPVKLVGHHGEHGGIVRHRFHAHVPVSGVNICAGAIGAHFAGGFVNLFGKSCGQQNLSQQRIRIERNGSDQILQLLVRELDQPVFLRSCVRNGRIGI